MLNTSSKKNRKSKFGLLILFVSVVVLFFQATRLDAVVQDKKTTLPENEGTACVFYDKMPEVIGGFSEIQKKTIYPESAKKAGIQGKVVVEVFLDKNGEIKKTKIIQSLKNGECDSAAVFAVKNVKWKPAYQGERPVPSNFAIPIAFKLQ